MVDARHTWRGAAQLALLGLALSLGACSKQPTTPTTPGPGTETPTGPGQPDTTPPATPSDLKATSSAQGITLQWLGNAESDLAGYRVYRSDSEAGTYTLLTPAPDLLTVPTYQDTVAPQGVTSYYRVVAVDKSGNASAPATQSALRPSTGAAPKIELQNLDGAPYNDRLVFSRIGSLASPPKNGVHDTATLRIKNTDSAPLRITGLPVTDAWVVDPPIALPVDVPANGSLDVRLKFVAETNKVHGGTLTIVTDAGNTVVTLAGLWQSLSENNQEPTLQQIRDAFGYKTSLLGSAGSINQKGAVVANAKSDEVLAAYWQRLDETQPVTVRQLAAYHTQGNTATMSWYNLVNGAPSLRSVFTHAGIDGQSLFPHLNGSSTNLAIGSFTPTKSFGFKVDSEWSDPTRNGQAPDLQAGCAEPCGQHLRFWTLKDRAGAVVPGSYFVAMDYSGINYDFQDNVYLVTNIKPAPVLVNVGGQNASSPNVGGQNFTDPSGNIWTADRYSYTDQNKQPKAYTYYTPSDAIAQPDALTSVEIANTDNDVLYRSYRHNNNKVNPPPAQDQRVETFSIPINNGTYQVKLHFAELYWNEPGKRLFDVGVQGVPTISNLDIFARSGGKNTALVIPIDGVNVTDGKLSLSLKAQVDFPSISGIEIVR